MVDCACHIHCTETLIKTQRILCMEKCFDDHKSTGKVFLDSYLAEFGGAFLVKCNYDVRFLPDTLPKFYKECLTEWALYKMSPITTLSDVLNEIIWNNKFLCIYGKPLFRNKLLRKGLLIVSDLLTDSGTMKSWRILQNKTLPVRSTLSLCVSLILFQWRGRDF